MRIISLLAVCISVFSESVIDSKIRDLEETLFKYSTARNLLNEKKSTNDLTPVSVPLSNEEWLLPKLIPRFYYEYEKEVVSVQFITLKPIGAFRDTLNSLNVALLIGYADGRLDVLQHTGEILCSYTLPYTPIHLATTSNYDEIKFALISPALTLDIFDLSMEKHKKANDTEATSTLSFKITKETSEPILCENPTSLIFYVKTGKKFWIIGDEAGNLNIHLFNGTFFKKTETQLGRINALERFGQTMVFASESSVGVLNPGTLELLTVCHDIGKINDVCIDTLSSSAYVYAITDEKIIALDTKYHLNNENFCKVIGSRNVEDRPKTLACVRNFVVTWGDDKPKLHNTTFYYSEEYKEVLGIKGVEGEKRMLEGYRIQSGGSLFVMSSEKELMMYEVVLPYKIAPPFDFGNVRFLVIILAVGGAMLWQYYKKGSGSSQTPITKSRKYSLPKAPPKRRY